jgi:probable lipoprotein NlpC
MMNGHSPAGCSRFKILVVLLNLCALALCPGLFAAAPLQGAYAQGGRDSASPEQKAQAIREARLRLISAAEKYRGTPYRYAGIDGSGLDCSGLVYISFRDALGVSVPRTTTGLYAWVEKIDRSQIQPGDLLFFKTDNSGNMSHVGIYAGNGRFIHSASAGPSTGVIVSSLDEKYWSRTYAGAGRALPALNGSLDGTLAPDPGTSLPAGVQTWSQPGKTAAPGGPGPGPARSGNSAAGKGGSAENSGRLLLGIAMAPSWNGFYTDDEAFRGLAAQLFLGAETHSLSKPMVFGLELRPEWDRSLGVFRMPITLSWGLDNKFRIFIGPVLSTGNAVLKTSGGDRHYAGGTSWIGAAGITAAPFTLKVSGGELSPYGEFAWQYYLPQAGEKRNWNADFAAGCRFSTGLRYTWRL